MDAPAPHHLPWGGGRGVSTDPSAAEQSGWTPLHLAIQRGVFLGVVNLLEHHADVHACNRVGRTPAHLAALKGSMAILQVLVKAGAQLDIQEGVGCTPLQLALRSQKQNMIAFLEGKEPSSLALLGDAEPGAQMKCKQPGASLPGRK